MTDPRTLSPRKIFEAISEGKLKPQYIGKHTYETLEQMIFSWFNGFKPQVMTHREVRDALQKLIGIYDAIKKDITPDKKRELLLIDIYANLKNSVDNIDSNKDKSLIGAICEMTEKSLIELEEKPCECKDPNNAIKTNQEDDGLMHS